MILLKPLDLCRFHWRGLTLGLWLAIAYLSLTPLPQLPAVPGSDKTHHFIAYAVLVIPITLQQPKGLVWYLLGFLGLSGLIELAQPFVNRYGEWQDLFANAMGISIGWTLGQLFRYGEKYYNCSIASRDSPSRDSSSRDSHK